MNVGSRLCMLGSLVVAMASSSGASAEPLVYEGTAGAGRGKHIVFLAGDHEYRSEETLPALARILAKRHGFRCTVLFTVDPDSGVIAPGANYLPGTEVLSTADLMVIFLRFKDLPADQMQPIVDYLDRGGPVVGLRTSTHAFNIVKDSPYLRFSYESKEPGFEGGFGRQILGETWAGHYGKNHVMSTRLDLVPEASSHPILRGVADAWVQSGGYWTDPTPDSQVLAMAQPLASMSQDAPPAADTKQCPGAWVRTYSGKEGRKGRVFASTYGASEDILNDGYGRMLVNACFWAAGLDEAIDPKANIDFVGPYHPTTFRFDGHRQQVLPSELAGWDSPIMPLDKPILPPAKKTKKNKPR